MTNGFSIFGLGCTKGITLGDRSKTVNQVSERNHNIRYTDNVIRKAPKRTYNTWHVIRAK